jgi:hypothetical protein
MQMPHKPIITIPTSLYRNGNGDDVKEGGAGLRWHPWPIAQLRAGFLLMPALHYPLSKMTLTSLERPPSSGFLNYLLLVIKAGFDHRQLTNLRTYSAPCALGPSFWVASLGASSVLGCCSAPPLPRRDRSPDQRERKLPQRQR